jgi:hypothetical protein
VSQPEQTPERSPDGEDEIAPTPFDNPFFLPVILIGFAIWFTYDGWWNPNIKAVMFNRVMSPITGVLAAFYTYRAVRERRNASGSTSNPGA